MASSSRLSYPRRLFLWLLGYSVILVGSFAVFQYHREKAFKAEEMNARLQTINSYILAELESGRDVSQIDLSDFHPFEDIRLSVISQSGRLLYDNSIDTLPVANHIDREEIRQALAHKSGYTVRRHSESTGENYFYSATRGSKGEIVRTAVPYSVSLSALLRADYGFLWIIGLISALMCVLGYFVTRRIGQHILRLDKFAGDIDKGVRVSDMEPFPNDELGAISNNIVRLYAKLQQADTEREREHRAALYQEQEKQRIKKQLTNNINHELKTPVAAIRVCVETLLARRNISAEKREQFLQSCFANVERLQRLLDDVSLLTRMDDGSSLITKEPLDLAQIIDAVAKEHCLVAKTKGMTVENKVEKELKMCGNASLLEAVFNNLIDNALSYSGGTFVRISLLGEKEGKITLEVRDNGEGVAEEHLSRLFERFYRIDKGRSRAVGGTGLGLSIVKNAVMLHGGSISVENIPTGGLSFRITLARGLILD